MGWRIRGGIDMGWFIKGGTKMEPKVVIEEVTDPVEIARDREQHEEFIQNCHWLQDHWPELLPQARGRFIAVAGQEAFLADTPQEALKLAESAHPSDKGIFVQYVLTSKVPRIYANRG
jgi:hypothetical protein